MLTPALVHWSDDGWATVHDNDTQDTGLGIHLADLPTHTQQPGTEIVFTFFWHDTQRWEGTDFVVRSQLEG